MMPNFRLLLPLRKIAVGSHSPGSPEVASGLLFDRHGAGDPDPSVSRNRAGLTGTQAGGLARSGWAAGPRWANIVTYTESEWAASYSRRKSR